MKPTVIAVAGKGGTGKTTLCGMLVRHLCEKDGYVLVVDADPNSNLNEVLGVEVETTLGDIREQIARSETGDGEQLPPSMTKQEYASYMFGSALTEEDGFDMLVMGRTQGEGCYCYVNGVLKAQIDKYSPNYRWIVVDNEAGMEHISRGTLPHIDILLLVSDCSRRGIQAAGRLNRMVEDLKLRPAQIGLVVNRTPEGSLDAGVSEEIALQELQLLGTIPQDDTIYRYDCDGFPTADVPAQSPAKAAITQIIDKLGL
ncbi:MAG: AAA family ATPase [Eggerthellaceae bacterium]|nr:AAA family ATPase [Eggerthellaceae bacterium]